MLFSEILQNPHFNNTAALIRVAFQDSGWRNRHPEIPFWYLLDQLNKSTPVNGPWNHGNVIKAITDLLTNISKADKRLLFAKEDLEWLVATLDGESGHAIIKMWMAWCSAPDESLTPVEVAEKTGTAESTWRNKAAQGEIPGAVKKGKQWLLPRSVIRSWGYDV